MPGVRQCLASQGRGQQVEHSRLGIAEVLDHGGDMAVPATTTIIILATVPIIAAVDIIRRHHKNLAIFWQRCDLTCEGQGRHQHGGRVGHRIGGASHRGAS